MPLSSVLANIPGAGGWLAGAEQQRQQGAQELGQATSLMGLIQHMQQQQAAQKKMQQDEMLRRAVAEAGSPEAAIPLLIKQGPEGIRLAGVLAEATKDLRPKTPEPFTLSPGAIRYGPDGKVIAEAPHAPEKPEANPEIVKLGLMLDKLPAGHPMRTQIQKRIELLTTRQPAVQVNMPASSDLLEDAEGNMYRVRIGKDGQTERVPLGSLRPPAPAAARKDEREAAETQATIQSVRDRIGRMAKLVQGGAMAGGVVGPLGLASRVGETAAGALSDIATPAIDFKNEQALLLADVRKMVEKDPNLSKDERERLYETLGGGITQTPGSSIRTLNNVLNYIESKKTAGRSRAARVGGVTPPPVGTVQRGYRFKGGDPAKPESWEKVS